MNSRELNSMCPTPPHFVLDTLKQTLPRLERGTWMCKIDIRDAYHHVPLSTTTSNYFALQMTPIAGHVYTYQSLPFGFSWSPFIFQRFIRQTLRASGVKEHAAYLDDILIWGHSPTHCLHNTANILQTLHNAGWLVNVKKSILANHGILSELMYRASSDPHQRNGRRKGGTENGGTRLPKPHSLSRNQEQCWDNQKDFQPYRNSITVTQHGFGN